MRNQPFAESIRLLGSCLFQVFDRVAGILLIAAYLHLAT